MLSCIACVNKEEDGGRDREEHGGDTPSCRDPVKSLTSQVRSTYYVQLQSSSSLAPTIADSSLSSLRLSVTVTTCAALRPSYYTIRTVRRCCR
jgi:hypothetical protein